MSEGKRNIIAGLIQEYDIKTVADIQKTLKELLGGKLRICEGNVYHTRLHVVIIRCKLTDFIEGRWIGRSAKFLYGTDTDFIED